MSARDAILGALRAAAVPAFPRPPAPAATRLADPVAAFLESVKAVGGASARVSDVAALDAALRALPVWVAARRTVSLVPGAGASTVDLAAVADPHDLEGLEVAVLPGALGVAENGAVWLPGSSLGPHRAVFVIPEHLVLVVRAADVVDDMQAAYARLEIERPGYGVFVSGPSKTADIEQSLVIGAHGPRSCTAFVVG